MQIEARQWLGRSLLGASSWDELGRVESESESEVWRRRRCLYVRSEE